MKFELTPKLFPILLALLAPACSYNMSVDTKVAESAAEKFHAQFNQEKYRDIYAETGDEFKKLAKEEEFTELLAAVHRKLGAFKSSSITSWRVNYTPGGSYIMLGVEATFEEGKGTEQFTWVKDGEQVRLVGYNINSSTLIIK